MNPRFDEQLKGGYMNYEIITEQEERPCLVYNKDSTAKCLFRGFCDNNSKCVIECENGELHKVEVWKVKFVNARVGEYDYFFIQKRVKELEEFIYDVNPVEIASHIADGTLEQWCNSWRHAAEKVL